MFHHYQFNFFICERNFCLNSKESINDVKASLKTIRLIISLYICVSTMSCKHEVPQITPATADSTLSDICNSDTVYFKNTIQPLLQTACAYSGCHDAASHEDDVILDTYENIIRSGKVKAGNPDDSKLYKVIVTTDADDIMPPPPNQPLSATQISTIYTWIMQGAKNNGCLQCDSMSVTYSQTIKPIIESICKTCHNPYMLSGNLILNDYSDVAVIAANGKLTGTITHAPGYVTMPDFADSTKYIGQCQIKQIIKWVNDGYPNN